MNRPFSVVEDFNIGHVNAWIRIIHGTTIVQTYIVYVFQWPVILCVTKVPYCLIAVLEHCSTWRRADDVTAGSCPNNSSLVTGRSGTTLVDMGDIKPIPSEINTAHFDCNSVYMCLRIVL